MSHVLSIDPGRNTGWCIFKEFKGQHQYRASGVVRSQESDWASVAKDVAFQVAFITGDSSFGLTSPSRATQIVIEMAEMFNTSASYASIRRGNLLDLIYLTGVICGALQRVMSSPPILVKPMEWKGQLPKSTVIKRLQDFIGYADVGRMMFGRHWPESAWIPQTGMGSIPRIRDHEADAIGIGLWHLGLFGRKKG